MAVLRPMDIASIRERRQARLEQAERALERARSKRRSIYEAAIAHAAKQRLSIAELKSDPAALKRAIARGQVKRIARKASPLSKDTNGLFTADHARYALTDLYKPTVRERVGLVKERTGRGAASFWDKHKTKIVVGAVGLTAAYLLYVTAVAAKGRTAMRHPAGRHLTGHLYPASPRLHQTGMWSPIMPPGPEAEEDSLDSWYDQHPAAEEWWWT